MGGHGGLNILPQKSWHVYNWDNREKVRKDEEEHAAKEEALREEQLQRDAEIRRQLLLQKARLKRLPPGAGAGAGAAIQCAEAAEAEAHPETAALAITAGKAAEDKRQVAVGCASPSGRGPEVQAQKVEAKPKHINFFEEIELEVAKAGAAVGATPGGGARQAGNDLAAPGEGRKKGGRKGEREEKQGKPGEAENDIKFSLGYGATGPKGEKPWYVSRLASELAQAQERVQAPAGTSGRPAAAVAGALVVAAAASARSKVGDAAARQRKAHSGASSDERKWTLKSTSSKKRRKSADELRKERVQRERHEQIRSQMVLSKGAASAAGGAAGAAGPDSGLGSGSGSGRGGGRLPAHVTGGGRFLGGVGGPSQMRQQRYNSGFGYGR
eukprot:jgi/Mesen1/1314/ME000013S00802